MDQNEWIRFDPQKVYSSWPKIDAPMIDAPKIYERFFKFWVKTFDHYCNASIFGQPLYLGVFFS